MGIFSNLFGKKEKAKSYVESDNMGTRIQDMKSYQGFLMQQFTSGAPFVQFTFETAEAATEALLKLPFIHRAADSNRLICSEPFSFGVYRDEVPNDPEFGKYNAIVAGKGFTLAMYNQMCSICKEAGASKYGGIEPKN